MHKPFQGIRQAATFAWHHALNLVLPPTCIACHNKLPATEPVGFCPTCYQKMPWWNTATILSPNLPPAIASFRAPCLYEEPLRQTILNLKFHDATHTAPILAKLMAPLLPAEKNLLLIPVPSHPSRLRKRLYNHAALLTQHVAQLTNHPTHLTALKRTMAGPTQAQKTRAARLKLPGTAFSAKVEAVTGKHVVLIDDIFTTGATARACALALRRAGAARVSVITLAYTAPH